MDAVDKIDTTDLS